MIAFGSIVRCSEVDAGPYQADWRTAPAHQCQSEIEARDLTLVRRMHVARVDHDAFTGADSDVAPKPFIRWPSPFEIRIKCRPEDLARSVGRFELEQSIDERSDSGSP